MSDMKTGLPPTGPLPSEPFLQNQNKTNTKSHKKQQHSVYEVVQNIGSLAKRKSNEKMNGEWILKRRGRKMYYKAKHNSIEEINVILGKVNFEKIHQHNYYFPYEINKIFLALLAISGVKSKKQEAIMWLKHKDGTFKQYGPFSGGPKKHSEDCIIDILDKDFNASDYTECWIYSTNCPCLCKNNWELKDHNPCMINLYFLRVKLEETYNIKTYVGFSRFYGISGSFMDLLPYNPIKHNNFPIKNRKNVQKIKKKDILKDFDKKLLSKSNEHITELKDRKFEIKKDESDTEYKSKYSNLIQKIPGKFTNMVLQKLKELFQYFKFPATFHQFIDKGWKKLADFKENLAKEFGTYINSDVQQSFFKNVEELFLDWWNQIVKNAFSTFLNEILDEDLKMLTFQAFLNDIPDSHKNFIGCLDHTIEHFQCEIQPNSVIVMYTD